MIDWLMSVVIALAVLGGDKHQTTVQYLAIAIFAAEVWLLTALTGFTVGKRLLGLRVAGSMASRSAFPGHLSERSCSCSWCPRW
jgi:hypothetical protein